MAHHLDRIGQQPEDYQSSRLHNTWVDWGDALVLPTLYGREQEIAHLMQWIVQEHSRVVSVLGMGGIGKSVLSISIMHQLVEHFEVVIFRSLRDAPSCEVLLDDCLQSLRQAQGLPQSQGLPPATLEQNFSLLLEYLRKVRVLVVLDNMEGLLEENDVRGHFRPGFEAYEELLCRVIETSHQSCLLFTSRERPAIQRLLEGRYSQVLRALHLEGLDVATCKQIIEEKGVLGTSAEQEQLITIYGGNPLALKIVAETIVDLFGGEISLFLAEGTMLFGNITDLLEEQLSRLSPLEQSVHYWLAIAREPMTLDELRDLLVPSLPHVPLLEAVDGLRRRSLIEPGKYPGSFTLQSVVLEYVTATLIAEGSSEIQEGRLDRLIKYNLELAGAKEYVRQTQVRLLLSPLLTDLQSAYWEESEVEVQLLSLLDELREQNDTAQGYGPANLIALLRLLRGHLSNLDLSKLCIRGAYLQNIEMHDASLAGAMICDTAFTQSVSVTWTVAMSLDGKWWAAGSLQGKMRIWQGVRSQSLRLIWQAHSDRVLTLAFSPDGRTLASGSQDGTVKLWDLETCSHEICPRVTLLWTGRQHCPLRLAFSFDGTLLASAGLDATVRLWDVGALSSGYSPEASPLQMLTHSSDVFAVAFGPDGSLLASGCVDGEIRLWERQKGATGAFAPLLSMQSTWVSSLAFAPDGRTLAGTGMGDQTVKLWDVGVPSQGAGPRGCLLHTLSGHANQSRCVAWSPDGRTLAYSSTDRAIMLWDVEQGRCQAALHGHTADIYGMVFTPEGKRLLSGSADCTLRVWDVNSYRCERLMEGYGICFYNLDWSPDGMHLICGRTDGLVTLWNLSEETTPGILYGHGWIVFDVGWSPDGRFVASCGLDMLLCLWDPVTLVCIQRFENPEALFLSIAWSPDSRFLACGTYGRGIQVWDMATRSLCWVGQALSVAFHCVVWSPDGMYLVGGGDDGCVYVWEYAGGVGQGTAGQDELQPPYTSMKLAGHRGRVISVGWSPDGKQLVSGSVGSGELFVWDIKACRNGMSRPVQTFIEHSSVVSALVWGSDGDWLISGDVDGILRWWDVSTGRCIKMRTAHQGTIHALKISPDGRRLASCGDDGVIMIWDLASFEHLQTLRHDRPYERLNITGVKGLAEAERASLKSLGAIEQDV